MTSNFSIIEQKLNDFISKFYSNRIVLGIIIFIMIALLSLVSVFIIEGFAFMLPSVKTILFFFLIFLFASVFIFFILIPSCKLLRIIPFLSYQEAASIIQNYFPNSKDLIVNILQLHDAEHSDLLVAAINQKIEVIKPLNFTNAINYKKTLKFFLYSLALTLLSIVFTLFFHQKIKDGAERFMNYSTFYQPENPYSISIVNDSLCCAYGEDFTLKVRISGPSAVNDVFIKNDFLNVRMKNDSIGYYSYTLKKLNSNLSFSLNYLGFVSESYEISVFFKPSVFVSRVTIVPPSYTKIDSEEFDNSTDLTVPFGSQISWSFEVQHSDSFHFFADSSELASTLDGSNALVAKSALTPFDYSYSAIGEDGSEYNSSMFHVNLVPDYSPQIVAVSAVDSSAANSLFFTGKISDDYGFHSLTFNYFDSSNPKDIYSNKIEIVDNIMQDFYYYFDFSNLSKTVSYYFEVMDNDPISGFKSARTPLSVYTTISNEEKQQRVDNLNKSIFDKFMETQRLINQLNSDIDSYLKDVSSNNQISDYEKQLKINNLLEKRDRLNKLLEELSQENQSKNAFENQLSENMSKELKEEQQMIQNMWNELLGDDLKDLLDKINKLAKSQSERDLKDNISDLKFDFNQISEQLDRNNQLMQMYNIDTKIQNLSNDLNQMSKEYSELSKKLNQNSDNSSKSAKDSKNKPAINSNKNNANESTEKPISDQIKDFEEKFNQKFNQYQVLLKQNNDLGDSKLDINDVKQQFENLKNDIQRQQNEMNQLDMDLGNKPQNQFSRENQQQNHDSPNDKSVNSAPNNSEKSDMNTQKNAENSDKNTQKNAENSDKNNQKTDENYDKNTQKADEKSDSEAQNQDKNAENNSKNAIENSKDSDKLNENSDRNQNKLVDNKSEKPENRPNSSESPQKRRENLSQKMEQSSEDMEDLSEQLKGNQKSKKKKKHAENLNDIRQILDNLVAISFNQESALNLLKNNSLHSVLTNDVLKIQNDLQKDFALVQDSIYALAKRVPEMGHAVYEKINNIHNYFGKIQNSIYDDKRSITMSNQQFLLTNVNDLSLIFSEIENQMQKQMDENNGDSDEEQESVRTRNQKQSQQRQKSTQQIKSQQQKLKESLEQMLQQLQEGKEPNSQQLAEVLRKQEMMMQKLKEMQDSKGVSSQEQKLMNQIQQMIEESKRDVVNRNITKRTVERQNTLFNKLLELEKAEKSQDLEQERESNQGSDIQPQQIDDLNLKLKDFGVKEYLKYSPIDLNLFYQNKYNEYIQNIE